MTGVVAEFGYTLGAQLDLSKSELKFSFPMRYLAYSTASVLGGTTRQSMLPTDGSGGLDLSILSVKIVNGANSYYASSLVGVLAVDATNDLLTA